MFGGRKKERERIELLVMKIKKKTHVLETGLENTPVKEGRNPKTLGKHEKS